MSDDKVAPKAEASKAAGKPRRVELKGVTKEFVDARGETFTAIKDVDLIIEDLPDVGEFHAILGPSGCGKSTVLNLIAGLITPTKGSVKVRGVEVTGPGPDRGMVFQSYSSMPWLTVLDNVAYGLRLRGVGRSEREATAKDLIAKVGLKGHEHKYPKALSGGQRQRVAIARTLAARPSIILMDEPFGALDVNTRIEMQDLLLKIWDELEATVMFVTHDIAEAVYVADTVYIFAPHPGRVADKIKIELPYPRSREVKNTPRFRQYETNLLGRIHELAQGSRGGAEMQISL